MSQREDGPFVVRLPREPGRRDSRYAHLFSGAISVPAETERVDDEPMRDSAPASSRLERLEQEVRDLQVRLRDLEARLPRPLITDVPGDAD